ncbi:MAG: Rne/Rng family ribonuclease [Deltaproteobacteria bacterium]|nr:Rne/Rng family ribonuclease [Deltaproteobacteria bacterium]
MGRKILINAVDPEEFRVAIVEDGILQEFYIESNTRELSRGNIYKAIVANVEPSLQAVFVDFGEARNGFLQINEIHPEYFQIDVKPNKKPDQLRIQDVIKRGQEILVQVTKEESERKGAALTTYLSMPGRYIVLMPGRKQVGVSRKIEDEAERQRLKEICSDMNLPPDIGCIIRTAGMGQTKRELKKDLSYMLRLWSNLKTRAREDKAPCLIYKDEDLGIRTIRDYFTPDTQEILIDNKETYQRLKEFMGVISPVFTRKLRLNKDDKPVFAKYHLEEQIEEIYKKQIRLSSGGFILIEPTEALVTVDVNSGKHKNEKDMEGTAFKANMEAAGEIARQLRLRDLGGLIVIDFIDMKDPKHNTEVVKELKNHLKKDKARTTVGKISKFGLLELGRQHIRPAIQKGAYIPCAQCQGLGIVKSPEAAALASLRKLVIRASKGDLKMIKAVFHHGVASYLLNQKRSCLAELEEKHKLSIMIEGDAGILPEEGDIVFIKRDACLSEPNLTPAGLEL